MAAIQGDWYASRSTHGGEAYPQSDDAVRFVYAIQPNGEKYIVAKAWADDGDYESTAKVIAAAPRMLALLKRAEREWAMGIDAAYDWMQDARAVIRKAEGRTDAVS